MMIYVTTADIVRARVRTFGVEEHKFVLENGMMGAACGISKLGITNDYFRSESRLRMVYLRRWWKS